MFTLLFDLIEDTTVSANIAQVPVRLFKRKKKRKRIVSETATPGSTNMVSISNDFGTDSPRLPSELGDLTGNKSYGMGSGKSNYDIKGYDPDTKKLFSLLTILNTDGQDHVGGSTKQSPIVYSSFDEYVPSGGFIMKDELEEIKKRDKAVEGEMKHREDSLDLLRNLQDTFISSTKG